MFAMDFVKHFALNFLKHFLNCETLKDYFELMGYVRDSLINLN